MTSDSAGEVRKFWDDRAADSSLPSREVTHRDVWQRWLEIEHIKHFLDRADRVLDVGCGNGYTTLRIAPLVKAVVGIDTSEAMIRLARKGDPSAPVPVERAPAFEVLDVLQLSPATFGSFDVAISERCLINLKSWDDQELALRRIASVLRPGGRFLFMEGSKDGRAGLNEIRKRFGLPVMPAVWHNLDFDEEKLSEFLPRFFEIEQELRFGVYDFVSRVVHPSVVAPHPPEYDSRVNEVAARLALDLQEFGPISRTLFLVLRRLSP